MLTSSVLENAVNSFHGWKLKYHLIGINNLSELPDENPAPPDSHLLP